MGWGMHKMRSLYTTHLHGWRFVVFCYGLLRYWSISFRVTSPVLCQSYSCPRASDATLGDMGGSVMWPQQIKQSRTLISCGMLSGIAASNIRTICHARDLWKFTRSCKQLRLQCPPWNFPGTAFLSGFHSSRGALNSIKPVIVCEYNSYIL